MENIVIQIILTIGGTLASIFALIRYMVSENRKREEVLLEYNGQREKQMLEYFEKKNGFMERMTSDFTKTSREQSNAIHELSAEIRITREKA